LAVQLLQSKLSTIRLYAFTEMSNNMGWFDDTTKANIVWFVSIEGVSKKYMTAKTLESNTTT